MDNLPGFTAIKGAYLSLYSPFPAMQHIAPLINTLSVIPVASVKPPIKVTTKETRQQRTSSKYEREQPLYAKDKTAAYQRFHCM